MMNIQSKKSFDKAFAKLPKKQQLKVKSTIKVFQENPSDKTLKNHALSGKMKGKRAISAGGDLRIIFTEKDNYIEVIMIDVGSHTQVYI